MKEQLAKAILETATIREDSYNNNAADAATKAKQYPDYSRFYTKTLEEAAKEACTKIGIDTEIARLLYLALDGWWNDTIAWAESILDIKETL